jgi:hypothetical protein
VSYLGKSYYRMLTGVFIVAFVITLAARIILFTQYTDYTTGFFSRETGIITVYTIVYWGSVAFLFLMSRLRQTSGDYPLPHRSVIASSLAILSGLSIVLYSLIGEDFPFIQQNLSPAMNSARDIATLLLGLIAGLSLLLFGVAGLSNSEKQS